MFYITCSKQYTRSEATTLAFNEKLLAGTPSTGIVHLIEPDEFEARHNGQMLCCDRVIDCCERALRRHGVVLDPEPTPTPEPVAVAKSEHKACPHFGAVKRCFAIFQEKGLSLDEGIRAVLAELLGREVPSRHTLSGSDWMNAGTLAKQLQLVG
jgi:hypothetical protein